jgi:type I restriction enzyme S subunit
MFEITQLGKYCYVEGGYAYKSENFKNTGSHKLIKIKNIRNGYIDYSNTSFIDNDLAKKTLKWQTRHKDVLISMTGSGPNAPASVVGRVAQVSKNDPTAFINQRIGRLRLKHDKAISLDFVFYLLKMPYSQNFLVSNSSGSANQANINGKIIEAIPCPVISYNHSVNIASILTALDDKIENNRRMNKTLEEMVRAIFKSWFVDFDPVHAKVAGNAPAHMDAPTAALFPSSFSENGLPVGWSFSTIGENGDVITGKTPSTKRSEYYGNEYPFIKIPNMTSVWVTETETGLSEAGHLTQFKKLLKKGTVIVSCIASPGEVSIVSKPSHTNQQVNAVVPNEECPTSWLYCALANLRSEVIGMASGGSVTANLNKTDFSLIKIIHSSNAIMNSFDKKVCSLFDKILSNDEENQTLSKLRDTLIPKFMSGEIRVKDAEREVEGVV